MTILHIDSAITGEFSASRELTAAIVTALTEGDPAQDVTYRDLAAEPLSHLTLPAFAEADSTEALAQFKAADTVVIGAPMYNFTVPSQLKAWIDRLLVAGETFRYTETGAAEGLMGGKRVLVAVARGGLYGEGSAAQRRACRALARRCLCLHRHHGCRIRHRRGAEGERAGQGCCHGGSARTCAFTGARRSLDPIPLTARQKAAPSIALRLHRSIR